MTWHPVYNKSNTTDATCAYPSGAPEFSPGFGGIRIARSLGFCVMFFNRRLSFRPFSFGHFSDSPSSILVFQLAFWYLQTLLKPLYDGQQ